MCLAKLGRNAITIICSSILLLGILLIYNAIWDFIAIFAFLTLSYLIGSAIDIELRNAERLYIQTIIGLGIIGVICWWAIFLRISNTSFWAVFFLAVLVIRRKAVVNLIGLIKSKKETVLRMTLDKTIIVGVFLFLLPFFFRPVTEHDATVKHIPFTLYMVRHDAFPNDVIQSIANMEPCILQYIFIYILNKIGAVWSLALFNYTILLLIFVGAVLLCKQISNSRYAVLLILFIIGFTPLFARWLVASYLDFLPTIFLFSTILILLQLQSKMIVSNIPIIGFLCGLAVFSKLTVVVFFPTIGIVCLTGVFIYLYENKEGLLCIKKVLLGLTLFFLPFLPSMFRVYYLTGNPVFPFYNTIFKSPYYSTVANFVDPFSSSPLSFSLNSLISIVIHTSRNIEMQDFSTGFFLLLMFLVPVSMVFYKNKKYYLLIGITISSYSISTIFTYNLRYYIPVFILMAIIISISVFSIKDFKQKGVDLYICILCLVIIMLPNLTYWKGQFGKIGIYSSKDIYTGHYSQLLESINREDVSVLFVDTPYKSGFLGKTYSLDWYCDALITRFMDEEVSVYDFIRSFDYVLYRNDHLIHSENLAAYKKQVFPNTPGVKGGLSLYRQDSIYSLYKVKDEVKDEYIIEAEDSDEIVVNSEQVYFLHFESNFGEYIFEADVRKKELYSGYFTSGKLQINWMDSNGRLIDVCYRPLFVEENTNRVSVEHIITPDNAAYGGLYLRTDADDELIINGFILKGKNKSFVETVTEEYYAAVEEKSLIPNFG